MRNRKYPLTKVGRKPLHGAYSYLRTGFCPKEKLYLERWMDSIVCEFIEDLGGKENVSTGQLVLLRQLKQNMVFQALIEEYVAEHGLIDVRGQVTPSLSTFYGMTVNQNRQNLALLGIKRVEGKEMDLQTYIRQNYPEPDMPAKGTTASQEGQGGAIGSDYAQRDSKGDSK